MYHLASHYVSIELPALSGPKVGIALSHCNISLKRSVWLLRPEKKVNSVEVFFTCNDSFSSLFVQIWSPFGSSRREFKLRVVSMSGNEASNYIPKAPIVLPEGPWKQVISFFFFLSQNLHFFFFIQKSTFWNTFSKRFNSTFWWHFTGRVICFNMN